MTKSNLTEHKMQEVELLNKIELLKSAKNQYVELMKQMLTVNNGNIYSTDLYMQGVAQKSIDLIESVFILFKGKKYLTIISLLQMHFEALLNIYALFIVENPNEISMNIMRGKKRIDKYKDRGGVKR